MELFIGASIDVELHYGAPVLDKLHARIVVVFMSPADFHDERLVELYGRVIDAVRGGRIFPIAMAFASTLCFSGGGILG